MPTKPPRSRAQERGRGSRSLAYHQNAMRFTGLQMQTLRAELGMLHRAFLQGIGKEKKRVFDIYDENHKLIDPEAKESKELRDLLNKDEVDLDNEGKVPETNIIIRRSVASIFHKEWKNVYGFDFDYRMCFADYNMYTMTEVAKQRNDFVLKMLRGSINSVFDCFTGKGADFFTWAMVPGIQRVYANLVASDKGIFERNKAEFLKACSENKANTKIPNITQYLRDQPITKNKRIPDFFNHFDQTLPSENQDSIPFDRAFDVLYMDPPWTLDADEQMKKNTRWEERVANEEDANTILFSVCAKIIAQMKMHNLYARAIIIKGRWNNDTMTKMEQKLPNYIYHCSMEATQIVHPYSFHIFLHVNTKSYVIHNSEAHDTLFRIHHHDSRQEAYVEQV